jgi:DNA-directed RNA polymerase subunit N
VIADKWEEFSRRVKNGEAMGKILDDLGVERYCCRRMLISHVNIIDELLKYDITEDGKKRGTQK